MNTSDKFRVVHIIGGFRFGGIEKLVYDLVSEQKRSATICPYILVVRSQGEFSHRFKQLKVPITAINPKSNYCFDLTRIKKILSVFKQSDIIHFHGFHHMLAILALLYGKKILYTEHGNFAFGRKKTIKDRGQHFLRKCFYKWFVDVVACNSKFTKNYLQNSWKLRSNKIKVIYNGSMPEKINENEVSKIREYYGNKFIIGTTSRLAEVKQINRLVHAYIQFALEFEDVILIIVGEGPERDIIEKEAGQFFNKRIFLPGFKPNPSDYQSAFDVCVFPSKNESFGLVAVESYNARKPVLVFEDGGGLMEIVSMCDPDDVVTDIKGLVNRIKFYYSTREEKNTTELLKYFSAERMASEYYLNYEDVLCSK